MGYADSHTDPGATEALAFDQDVVDCALIDAAHRGSALRELLKRLLFVRRAELCHDAPRRDQIGNFHLPLSPNLLDADTRAEGRANLTTLCVASAGRDRVPGRSIRYCRLRDDRRG